MSLMGTLAKVALGYAAARGVDKMSRGQGLSSLLGGAQIRSSDARAATAPGTDQMQALMAQMGGGMAGMQDMMSRMAAQSGFDLSALGGAKDTTGSGGGLLSSVPQGGAGMAGALAAMGGAAAMTGKGVGGLLDQFSSDATPPEAEASAGILLRAMIQAAKADGDIDAEEQQKIMEHVGDATDDDIAFIQAQLAAEVDVDALAADTPKGMEMQVYSMSLMSIRVDSAAEAEYLDALAQALGLNQQTVNALHMQMGVQPLYS